LDVLPRSLAQGLFSATGTSAASKNLRKHGSELTGSVGSRSQALGEVRITILRNQRSQSKITYRFNNPERQIEQTDSESPGSGLPV
jgi:hypothetical protein